MECGRLSLFTNRTRPHYLMVTSIGVIPADPIVMVASASVGAVGFELHEKHGSSMNTSAVVSAEEAGDRRGFI